MEGSDDRRSRDKSEDNSLGHRQNERWGATSSGGESGEMVNFSLGKCIL